VKQTREAEKAKVRARAEDAAEDRILDILIPTPRADFGSLSTAETARNATRQAFRKKLREGQLADREIELEVAAPAPSLDVMGPAGMEEMTEQIRGLFGQMRQGKKQTRKLRIEDAAEAARR